MGIGRRDFLKSSIGLGGMAALAMSSCERSESQNAGHDPLDEVLSKPVLKKELFHEPVRIESIALLRHDNNFILRVRSKDGAVGYSVSNNAHMVYFFPIVIHKIIPFFEGKDARNLDQLIDEIYVSSSNYKLQGLALWISLASVEFAILDLLGRMSGKSMGELIGDIQHTEIAVYQANNYRGKTARTTVELIKESVAKTGAKAIKIKIGGRMSKDKDFPPGRTERLIPLVRETFGDEMILYADSNGSYSVDKAIEVGHLLELNRFDFYEEPVPFDWLEETKQVADALIVPIAGGEQETSMHRFRWLIANDALQIVQPDMFYFGGMVRSMRVARMAEALGKPCTPHISGSGLGYVYMLHFVSTLTLAGPYHEFKGINPDIPFECTTSPLRSEDGVVKVPRSPGLGLELDPDFIRKHKPVTA
jgi:L-alanine-DL-glutamate epimerase-like enolase superfamily enzyme